MKPDIFQLYEILHCFVVSNYMFFLRNICLVSFLLMVAEAKTQEREEFNEAMDKKNPYSLVHVWGGGADTNSVYSGYVNCVASALF